MQNGNEEDNTTSDIYRLISELRQEALFINSEKSRLWELHKKIKNKTVGLLQSAWIATKKRLLLPQRDFDADNSQQIVLLGLTEFAEAKNVIGFQNAEKLGALLQILRTQPEQLAQWLIIGEHAVDDHSLQTSFMHSIVSGLYASFVFSDDIRYMLILLHELARYQLCRNEKPQRALKQATNSFSILYFMFHEVLLSAKYFLSAALEVPILRLLTIDYYLDEDNEKTEMRFYQDEKISSHFQNFDEYRTEVVKQLSDLVNSFVRAIRENKLNFPKPLSWLVFRIGQFITESFDKKEANAVVTELIFTMFVCPAIVNPEQYGICDAQITPVSRHNLMQVGRIVQNLALIKHEAPSPKTVDVYAAVDKNVIVQFLDELFSEMERKSPPVDISPFIFRDIALFTEQEINSMMSFLHKVYSEIISNESYEKQSICSDTIVTQLAALNISPLENSSKLHNSSQSNGHVDNSNKRASNIFSLVTRNHLPKNNEETQNLSNVVLIFSVNTDCIEPIGMLSENAIVGSNHRVASNPDSMFPIKHDRQQENEPNTNGDERDDTEADEEAAANEEVKATFANYHHHDEGSIGNTSDNLEAISEAASNHSVASSLEMEENEDQNDNYSDMVSANVSGRGTPNISGRDTPSSQVIENEDRGVLPEVVRQADNAPAQPPQLSRQIRSEIDDKFCKFEIKFPGPGGDETTSLISETWSTDVLASDNETIDATDGRIERHQYCSLLDQAIAESPGNVLDISETQSESAWSTDVMASDTERLTEVDNDDAQSIAQSDDTNSVAPSEDTRSETDENVNTRRFSNSSNSFVNYQNSSSNYHEFRKTIDVKQEHHHQSNNGPKTTHNDKQSGRRDNNANVIFKTFNLTSERSRSYTEQRCLETKSTFVCQKSLEPLNEIKEAAAGPSGLNHRRSNNEESAAEAISYMKSEARSKYEEGSNARGGGGGNGAANEILLSNCSLNSSSSGSSSNSFENGKTAINDGSEKWENKAWLHNGSQNSLNVTSTPSESTSELSVLSVTNIINNPIQMINKKTSNTLTRNVKSASIPSSTGAIPKSISFDVSADKGDKYSDDERFDQRSKRGGFFGKLRIGFRNRRGKSLRNSDEFRMDGDELAGGSGASANMNGGAGKKHDLSVKMNNNLDLSEDILAKYRTKRFVESSPIKINNDNSKSNRVRTLSESMPEGSNNNTVKDIKNKLRMVLSNTTAQLPGYNKMPGILIRNKIETVLRLELGKARKLKNWSNVARISEAIRCIYLLNEKDCTKVVQSMKKDLLHRAVYTQYLTSSIKDLLLSESYLDGLHEQICHEKLQCEEYLATICVDKFFRSREDEINKFCDEFRQLSLSDEKCDLLHSFYAKLYLDMKKDVLWKDIFRERKTAIKITMKRRVISKVYEHALYPNGDGDRDRDRVLHEHIEKLSDIITPDHKYLEIKKEFLRECPWLPAQEALTALSAYRTPEDKVNCVVHCSRCIMDLLAMAQRSSTTADELMPVLLFVIIQANPCDLMSTIQFVGSFYQNQNQLCGEELYLWTQFTSAVEFIKTMDYSD